MSEKFCLKWNDFKSIVTQSFSVLRQEQDFHDVTLVSEDETQIPAHSCLVSLQFFLQVNLEEKLSFSSSALPQWSGFEKSGFCVGLHIPRRSSDLSRGVGLLSECYSEIEDRGTSLN